MRSFTLTLAGLALVAAGAHLAMGRQDASPEPDSVRVGVFDSRAVAVAFANSSVHGSFMQDLHARMELAKEAGDTDAQQAIEAEATALQRKLHLQAFGTAPVDHILEHIQDELPAIAQQAGVHVIVSKWDVVFLEANANLQDVTDLLVAPFAPDEKTWGWIRDMQNKEPVPLEELEEMDHDH